MQSFLAPRGWRHHSSSRRFALLCSFFALASLFLAGCGGSSNKPTSIIIIDPVAATDPTTGNPIALTSESMDTGSVRQLTTQVKDKKGDIVTPTITWSSSNSNIVSVSSTGNLCAGAWDPTFVTCTATTAGTANITASAGNGLTATIPVTTHTRITSVTLTAASSAACVSQTKTLQYTAKAFSGSTDITASAGAPTFTSTATNVATIDASKGLVTAVNPGATQIYVTFGTVTSSPLTFVTCPPASITLHLSGDATGTTTTNFQLNAGDTKTLVADILDTLGNPMTGVPLNVTSAQPTVASASSMTMTAVGAGFTTVLASCTPPSCNASNGTNAPGTGVPIYSNLVTATVSGTSSSTVYVTGAIAADGTATNKTLIPISTTTNTPGTAITLPDVPNSMMFAANGGTLWVGTPTGLVPITPSSNAVGSQVKNALGTLLAVSPDGNQVVTSDAANTRVLIYNVSGSSIQPLPNITNASSAAFSPDGYKLFVAAQDGLHTYVTNTTPRNIAGPPSGWTSVTAIPQGELAYVISGDGSSAASYATCNSQQITTHTASSGTAPSQIAAAPNGNDVIWVGGGVWEDVAISGVTSTCPPAVNESLTSTAYPGFAPSQLVITGDSKYAFVTGYALPANATPQSALDYYDITAKSAGTASIAAGGGQLTSGGATLDGRQLYVGVKAIDTTTQTNAVHMFDLTGATPSDTKQISTTFVPQFVAVQPK